MKTIFHFGLLISLSLLIGCGQDAGTADVQGLPALKADPNAEKGGGSSGPSFSMKVDPTKMMMGRLDANGDGKITKEENPDGGLQEYDLNKDGTITREEMEKRNKEISEKGLTAMESDPDKEKEIKK